jgi:hypothetical protein
LHALCAGGGAVRQRAAVQRGPGVRPHGQRVVAAGGVRGCVQLGEREQRRLDLCGHLLHQHDRGPAGARADPCDSVCVPCPCARACVCMCACVVATLRSPPTHPTPSHTRSHALSRHPPPPTPHPTLHHATHPAQNVSLASTAAGGMRQWTYQTCAEVGLQPRLPSPVPSAGAHAHWGAPCPRVPQAPHASRLA